MLTYCPITPRKLIWNLKMLASKFGISKIPAGAFSGSMSIIRKCKWLTVAVVSHHIVFDFVSEREFFDAILCVCPSKTYPNIWWRCWFAGLQIFLANKQLKGWGEKMMQIKNESTKKDLTWDGCLLFFFLHVEPWSRFRNRLRIVWVTIRSPSNICFITDFS